MEYIYNNALQELLFKAQNILPNHSQTFTHDTVRKH